MIALVLRSMTVHSRTAGLFPIQLADAPLEPRSALVAADTRRVVTEDHAC